MAIRNKVYQFPSIPIEKQVFYVPGASSPGGFTVGGSKVMTYEPGGFAFLDIQPALQVHEWDYPETSWLMSQGSGKILRVRLAPTPQMAGGVLNTSGVPWDGDLLWSNSQGWAGDLSITFSGAAPKGSVTVSVDTSDYGEVFRRGHLIGHQYNCYMIDEVRDAGDGVYELDIMPPLRHNIVDGDTAYNRPYFTGQISNQSEIVQLYDAGDAGHIQMPKITMMEVIINE